MSHIAKDLSMSHPNESSFGLMHINAADAGRPVVGLQGFMPLNVQSTMYLGGEEPPWGYMALWANWNSLTQALREELCRLATEVAELRAEVRHVHEKRTFVVPITSLPVKMFKLIGQIPATIDGDGENFTATFTEANISASGETEADAIANLKDMLIASYEIFAETPANKLGPVPSRQWAILKSVIRRLR